MVLSMAELLFKLRNVPDDEAEDVRKLLNEHAIDFYETHAGSWSVSMPGIWLPDDSQLAEARLLLDKYQRERAVTARAAYKAAKEQGEHHSVFIRIGQYPLRSLMLLFALLFILYISLSPFLQFGK